MNHLPVVCTLDPEALKTRREGLLSQLVSRADHRERRPDGYSLRFAPSGEALNLVVRAINAERLCCRFLRFNLTVEPDEGPIMLDLTGPAGTGEFLAALIDE